MKGYVYKDKDENLMVKSYEYIQVHNPNFFGNTLPRGSQWWEFDTDNREEMTNMINVWKRERVPLESIHNFIRSVGYDTSSLKTSVEDLQRMASELNVKKM